MTMRQVILSVMASDRPGLTRTLAATIQEAGGNWLESHLSRLGGKYVGSVLVEIDPGRLAGLEAAVRTIDSAGLAVVIGDAAPAQSVVAPRLDVELIGQDRPGIVAEVTAVLAAMGANIDVLETSVESGAWSGERLFKARCSFSLPEGLVEQSVRDSLEALSTEIMVDLTVSGAEP